MTDALLDDSPQNQAADPTVVAVAMGYGHLRAACALADPLGVPVTRIDEEPSERALWARYRRAYEVLSRGGELPVGVSVDISGASDQLDATKAALAANYPVALIIVLIVAGLTATTAAARRAQIEAQRAKQEATRANLEAEAAHEVSSFLVDLFDILGAYPLEYVAEKVKLLID